MADERCIQNPILYCNRGRKLIHTVNCWSLFLFYGYILIVLRIYMYMVQSINTESQGKTRCHITPLSSHNGHINLVPRVLSVTWGKKRGPWERGFYHISTATTRWSLWRDSTVHDYAFDLVSKSRVLLLSWNNTFLKVLMSNEGKTQVF